MTRLVQLFVVFILASSIVADPESQGVSKIRQDTRVSTTQEFQELDGEGDANGGVNDLVDADAKVEATADNGMKTDTGYSRRHSYGRRRFYRRHRRALRSTIRSTQWRFGKAQRKINGLLYRKRILFRRIKGIWVKTRRSYWFRAFAKNSALHEWRWGKKTKKVKTAIYKKRVMFKKVGKKWVKTSRSYWRRVRPYRSHRRFPRYYQWRWGKTVKKVGKITYKRRIQFTGKMIKKFPYTYKWRQTRRSYWRRLRKSKKCTWRWGSKIEKFKHAVYRKRVLYCSGKKTKKTYWRRIHMKMPHRTGRWRWAKKTKKVKNRTYRLRVLYIKKKGKWVKTKRSYWRPATIWMRRHVHRYRRRYEWLWSKQTKKVKGHVYYKRILFDGYRGNWRPTQTYHWARKSCFWKWALSTKVPTFKRTRSGLYRKRFLFCKGKKTKRSSWRLIKTFERSRYYRGRYKWGWAKATKMIKKQLYRRRILFKRYRKSWRPTRRSYFRRCDTKCSKLNGKKVATKMKFKKKVVKKKKVAKTDDDDDDDDGDDDDDKKGDDDDDDDDKKK